MRYVAIIGLLLLLIVHHADADVTIGNGTTFNGNSPQSGALDCGSADNRYLLVAVLDQNGPEHITGVTYNSVSLGSAVATVSAGPAYYELKNPASGSNTIEVTTDSGAPIVTALCFSGVDQTTPRGTIDTDTSSSGSLSASVTVGAGGLAVDVAGSSNTTEGGGNNIFTAGGDQTVQVSNVDHYFSKISTNIINGTMTWTCQNAYPCGMVAAPINAASSPLPDRRPVSPVVFP